MLIRRLTERPYQDPDSGYFGATGLPIQDLSLSNKDYNPILGAQLSLLISGSVSCRPLRPRHGADGSWYGRSVK